jgi:hypothetical protein
MDFASRLTLNLRTRELGKLKTTYGVHERKGREALVGFLKDPRKMEGIDIDGAFGALRAPLVFVAARMGDFELFSLLRSLGSRQDLAYEGVTLFDTIVAWPQKVEFFRYLEETGASFMKTTKWGTLPILPVVTNLALEADRKARSEKHRYGELLEIYRFLVGKGVDLDEGGPGKITPLMIAACANSPEVVATLIADGADIGKRSFVEEIGGEVDCREYYERKTREGGIERNEAVASIINSQL